MSTTTPPAPSSARGLWEPVRQLSLAQARRRSDIVKLLRMLFTAAAAVSIGLLVGQLAASSISGISRSSENLRADEVVTMINPRFTGRDTSGEAYVITAESATRARVNEDLIYLVKPSLIDEFGGRISAPNGVYNQGAQTLELTEDVRVLDPGGYEFITTNAIAYVREGRIEGLQPLSGAGPLGEVRSDSYEISEDGEVIKLKGNVRMTFTPDEPEPEDETEDTPEDEASGGAPADPQGEGNLDE